MCDMQHEPPTFSCMNVCILVWFNSLEDGVRPERPVSKSDISEYM